MSDQGWNFWGHWTLKALETLSRNRKYLSQWLIVTYIDSSKTVLVFEYNKTSLPIIFQDELNVIEEMTSLGSDDNSQCSSGENVNLKNERKQTNEAYLDNKEDMFCSTASGDVDKYKYAFSSDIQDDRDDNGDQSSIHLSNIVESIVSTDDDVSLCSLTVCIFGINRFIILNP